MAMRPAHAISKYLTAIGCSCEHLADDQMTEGLLNQFDGLFVDPHKLLELRIDGRQNKRLACRTILVSELGDVVSDHLLEAGVADDLVMRPAAKRDVMDIVKRLHNGTFARCRGDYRAR